MSLREIVTYPDPVLAEIAKPVDEITDEIRVLAQDLIDTMLQADGIGLAANQVNVPLRMIAVLENPRSENPAEKKRAFVCINPEIVSAEGDLVWEEGCLSLPDITDKVKRKETIVVNALDLEGKPVSINAQGLMAVVFQHEIDHLNGKVFIDHLSALKRRFYKKKLQNGKKSKNRTP
jgi:peptide deformylase